ncbi:MAG TPA: DUF4349 domain-containing protein [Gaiellaceae bacterium]|nr:DUF4349 domain-containing protein [Gaiellaceae bacterium]
MSPLELVDDRFGELARELHAARPVAPEGLRERVRALAPPAPRRFELNLRMLVPAAGLAAIAVSLAVAGGIGVLHSPKSTEHGTIQARRPVARLAAPVPQAESKALGQRVFGATLAPAAGRLQQYDANLTVRVDNRDDLSKTTQDALRFTRRLGGFVVWARYAAPSDRGASELALRVPVDHVQQAIAHFSAYGTLVSQRIVLKDLQQRVDGLTARISRLRAEVAALKEQLGRVLTPERRALLEQRLQRDQAQVALLTRSKAASVRRASMSRIALTIADRPKPAAAPGRLGRTLHEAGSVLARELEVLLYALVVAGPLLLIGLAAMVAGRVARRRSDERLLERS